MSTAIRRLPAVLALVAVLASWTVVDHGNARPVLAQRAVEVPDIVGLSRDRANAAIKRAGLVVGDVRTTQNKAPRGTVIAQSPRAGTVLGSGSTVSYVVSQGPAPGPTATPRRPRPPRATPTPAAGLVVVPDVRGLAEADAVTRIRNAGLRVSSRQRTENAQIPTGRAVRTRPAAGASLAAGSGVELLISRGPLLVVVPDLVGRPRTDARDAIVEAGLTVGEVTSTGSSEPGSTVIDQDPAAGSRVRAGTAVAVTVSAGSPTSSAAAPIPSAEPLTARVPDVQGLSGADAIASIEDAGLFVSRTVTSPDASIEPGGAMGTDPGSGTVVEVGSEVVLTLSAGIDVAADGGTGPPDGTLLIGLVSLIILAGIAGVGATRLARRPLRVESGRAGPVSSIRTVSHQDRAPKIRIRGGGR